MDSQSQIVDNGSMVFEGKITLVINSVTAKVMLSNGIEILGTISGKLKLRHVQLFSGDNVKVEVSPYDLTKGRIIWREELFVKAKPSHKH